MSVFSFDEGVASRWCGARLGSGCSCRAALGAFVVGGAFAAAAAGLGAWWASGPKDATTQKTGVRVAPVSWASAR
jgi:hypothetical protein